MDVFNTLRTVDVSEKIEQKNRLNYLSWAWAWMELKKRYPLSYYTVYENKDQLNYHHDGKTAWVKVGVTVVTEKDGVRDELEHIEYLPVMDAKNASIPVGQITSFAVNKAIQRAMVKAIGRHGLALYIYAGEDVAEEEPAPPPKPKAPAAEIQRSPEAQKLFAAVDEAIQKLTKGMDADQKKAFAEKLKALVGKVNYKTITDVPSLQKLYDEFVKE